jgi:hypothetical protein
MNVKILSIVYGVTHLLESWFLFSQSAAYAANV